MRSSYFRTSFTREAVTYLGGSTTGLAIPLNKRDSRALCWDNLHPLGRYSAQQYQILEVDLIGVLIGHSHYTLANQQNRFFLLKPRLQKKADVNLGRHLAA